jgi:hypothetical protein
MNNQNENAWPDHWPQWVVESFGQLAETEKAAENFLPDSAPDWAKNVLLEVVKLSFPKMQLNKLDRSGPATLGAFCGHHQWLEESEYGLSAQTERLEKAIEFLDELLQKKLSKKRYARLIAAGEKYNADVEHFISGLDVSLEQKKSRIRAVIGRAEQQPLSEKSDFMTAYAEALNTSTFDDFGDPVREKFPGTSRIYTLMVLFWRQVDSLPTMKALHDWLCRMLGESAVGPYDNGRVKGICKRFGIHLAPRGRPSKKRH